MKFYKQQVGIYQPKSQVFLKVLVINLTVTKIFSEFDSSGSQAKLRNQNSVNNLHFTLVYIFALAVLLASVFT